MTKWTKEFNKFQVDISMILKIDYNMYENWT